MNVNVPPKHTEEIKVVDQMSLNRSIASAQNIKRSTDSINSLERDESSDEDDE